MRFSLITAIMFVLAALAVLIIVSTVYQKPDNQSLSFNVSVPSDMDLEDVRAEILYAGKTEELIFLKQSSMNSASVWRCSLEPDTPLFILPIRFLVKQTGVTESEYAGTHFEVLGAGSNHFFWGIEKKDGLKAIRLSSSGTIKQIWHLERRWVMAKIAVAILVLLFVFRISRHSEDNPHEIVDDPVIGKDWRLFKSILDVVFWLLLATAWTWPAVLATGHWAVGRHFDVLGTTWVIDAASRIFTGLNDIETSWPLIADYRRIDSFVLLLLSTLFRSIDPVRLHGIFQVIGVAVSAWAAQGFARAVGARRPWDMIAGLSFAFSGLSAHALLEGHVYHMMNPWLPLFAWLWWRALGIGAESVEQRAGSAEQGAGSAEQGAESAERGAGTIGPYLCGAGAGVFFSLSLLTTAYMGVSAAIIAVTFFVFAVIKHRKIRWKHSITALAVVAPILIIYLTLFGNGAGLSRDMSETTMRMSSLHLVSMVGSTPEVDRYEHSMAVDLMPVVLALVIVAPLFLKRRWSFRALIWTAVVGFLLAIGPFFGISTSQTLFRTPLALLMNTPFDVLFRFSLRNIWIWNLCAGALAALVAAKLAKNHSKAVWVLLILAILHPFLSIRLPARQIVRNWETPDVYENGTGPVLDLFPVQSRLFRFEGLWFSNLACIYQLDHQRALADNCVETLPKAIPRVVLGEWAVRNLLSGRSTEVKNGLAELGFETIVLHTDYFRENETEQLDKALSEFETPRYISTNAGVCLVAQTIPTNKILSTHSDRIDRYMELKAELTKPKINCDLPAGYYASEQLPQDKLNGRAAAIGCGIYLFLAIALYRRQWNAKQKRNRSRN